MRLAGLLLAALRRFLPADAFTVRTNWQPIKTAPVNRAVLVRHRDGPGDVYDVAVFVGRQDDGEMRWTMGDVRLISRQLTHWHELPVEPVAR